MSERRINVGCAIIAVRQNTLLLGKRKGGFGHGKWGLPGGHIEYGEKIIEAAKRELREETGIKNCRLTFAAVVNETRKDNHYIHVGFLAEKFAGNARLMEPGKCEEWRFFPLSRLPENIISGHRKLIRAFMNKTPYLD